MGYTLTWQNGRQLASLSGNGTTASYTYDVDGLRTSKTVNGVKHEYYYVGSRLQYEKYGTTELWFFYDAGGTPSGIRYKNGDSINDYYFVCNWRGDVIQIYNASGTLIGSYNYDVWGKVVSVKDASGAAITSSTHIANVNPIRYRGYYYDTETSLYYLKSRYYDPQVKRFLNADDSDIFQEEQNCLLQYNIYTYCFNNPANMNDDEGEMSITLKKKAASLGITIGILLIALKALEVVATPYIAIGVIAFAVGYLGYKVYKRAKGQKTKKKTVKKVEKKRRAMHLIGLKGNYKTGPNSEYSKIKKWLQRSKKL